MYGINKAGNSIVAHVHGFYPYFYVEAPNDFQIDDCGPFRQILNKALKARATQHQLIENLIVKVEYCTKASLSPGNCGIMIDDGNDIQMSTGSVRIRKFLS